MRCIPSLLIIVFTIVTVTSSIGQDYLNKIPNLYITWGPEEYEETLDYFKSIDKQLLEDVINNNLSNKSIILQIDYVNDSLLFSRILSKENLMVISDSSIQFEIRQEIVGKYFAILPEYLQYFTSKEMNNEAVLMVIFLLETLKQSKYLFDDMLNSLSYERGIQYKNKLNNSTFTILNGVCSILEDLTDEVDSKYKLQCIKWCNENLILLYDLLDDNNKKTLKNSIYSISMNVSDMETKWLLTDLYRKLE